MSFLKCFMLAEIHTGYVIDCRGFDASDTPAGCACMMRLTLLFALLTRNSNIGEVGYKPVLSEHVFWMRFGVSEESSLRDELGKGYGMLSPVEDGNLRVSDDQRH